MWGEEADEWKNVLLGYCFLWGIRKRKDRKKLSGGRGGPWGGRGVSLAKRVSVRRRRGDNRGGLGKKQRAENRSQGVTIAAIKKPCSNGPGPPEEKKNAGSHKKRGAQKGRRRRWPGPKGLQGRAGGKREPCQKGGLPIPAHLTSEKEAGRKMYFYPEKESGPSMGL